MSAHPRPMDRDRLASVAAMLAEADAILTKAREQARHLNPSEPWVTLAVSLRGSVEHLIELADKTKADASKLLHDVDAEIDGG
jgi:hypothetical protein